MAFWHRERRAIAPAPGFAALRGLPADEIRARLVGPEGPALLRAAARHGIVEAQLLLAQSLLDAGDAVEARAWFAAAAQSGTPESLNMLGRCQQCGWGAPADPVAARALFRRAADRGHGWARFNLGDMTLRGQGGPADRRAALVLFAAAARQGIAPAMNMVARYLEEGWDMPADAQAAMRWYRAAAERGSARACFNHATLVLQSGDADAAATLFAAALESGNPDVTRAVAGLSGHTVPALAELGRRAAGLSPPVER